MLGCYGKGKSFGQALILPTKDTKEGEDNAVAASGGVNGTLVGAYSIRRAPVDLS